MLLTYLFDQKRHILHFLLQLKISVLYFRSVYCSDSKTDFSPVFVPVLNVPWYFINRTNILIWCIYIFLSRLKQFWNSFSIVLTFTSIFEHVGLEWHFSLVAMMVITLKYFGGRHNPFGPYPCGCLFVMPSVSKDINCIIFLLHQSDVLHCVQTTCAQCCFMR